MADIQFVRPTVEMVEAIAADMRQADIDEVWAAGHKTPLEALVDGWKVSKYATIAMNGDEPACMFGLVPRDLLSGTGIIWMLGTNATFKYRREYLKRTPAVIDEMLTICPRLCNMVHSKNINSIRWLKWLGFTIEDPVKYGPDDELFHRFHKERQH